MIDNRQHLQDSTEFFALGLSMLEQTGKTNLIPELMQLLTPKQVIMLTQVYGGKTLRIPSQKELAITLKAALYLYQTKFFNLPEEAVKESLEVTEAEFQAILDHINRWQEQVCNQPGANLYSIVKGN